MKSFYVILMACIIGLTSSVEARKSKKIESPPWSEMAPAEKAKYEKEFKCNEASAVMRLVVKWPVTETTAPDAGGIYKKVYTLDEISNAVVGYKVVKNGKDIPVIALVSVGEVSVLAVEFNYVKYVEAAMAAGKNPEDVKITDAIKKSTGKYFCYAI